MSPGACRTLPNTLNTARKLKVGINYPWRGYGWDFGDPPLGWGSQPSWKSRISKDLETLGDCAIFAVRWFILGDGLNYGVGTTPGDRRAPYEDPTPPQWRFDSPPPLTQKIKDDFRELLDAFKDYNTCHPERPIKFLPSLVDFHWCFPGKFPEECKLQGCSHANWVKKPNGDVVCKRKCGRFVKGGRADVLISPTKRKQFFDNVLDPLLTISSSQAYIDHIYAWEVMNEPEWCTDDPTWWQKVGRWVIWKFGGKFDPGNKTVAKKDMVAFLNEGVARIEAKFPNRSTVGYAHQDTNWGTKETMPQFHYYPENHQQGGAIRLQRNTASKSRFVGEFATKLSLPYYIKGQKQPPDNVNDWTWLGNNDSVFERLKHMEAMGYEAAFLWAMLPANPDDGATDWGTTGIAEIKKYTVV